MNNIMSTLLAIRKKEPFVSLDFLNDTKEVIECIGTFAKTDNSVKTHLSRIMSVLEKGTAYDAYKKEFDTVKEKVQKHLDTHEKTEAEEEKLVSWERVMEVKEALQKQCEGIDTIATPKKYEMLQTLLVLCLYTEIPPRRNDYALMDFVLQELDMTDKDHNYYVSETRKFVFNVFKTQKEHGVQIFDVPDELAERIEFVVRMRLLDNRRVPLLINQNGIRINAVSAITRMLTKAFGHTMGTTALRHIYIAHKFPTLIEDTEERVDVANRMAHSLSQQVEYIKR